MFSDGKTNEELMKLLKADICEEIEPTQFFKKECKEYQNGILS